MANLLGHVDGIDAGVVRGWAADRDRPDELATVCFSSEAGHAVWIRPTYYRPDVVTSLGTQGIHGFSVPVGLLAGMGSRIVVHDGNGNPLEGGVIELSDAEHAVVEPAADPTLIYLHIQKTAGTSVVAEFRKKFTEIDMGLIYPYPHGLSMPQFAQIPLSQKSYYRVVAGHAFFGMHRFMGRPCRYATVMRDPVERVISHYWHRRKESAIVKLGDYHIPLHAAVNEGLLDEFDNLQLREIAGIAIQTVPLGQVSQPEVDLALYNVEQHFSWIGFADTLERDLPSLDRLLGWSIGSVARLNTRGDISNFWDDPDFKKLDLAAIRARHEPTCELYHKVRSKWASHA